MRAGSIVGAALEVALRQADGEIEVERAGHLLPEPLPHGSARAAAQHLAQQIAEGAGVVAVPGARFPPRALAFEAHDEPFPVVEDVPVGGLVEADHAGLVGEQMPHGDGLFAVADESGPDRGHRVVQGDQAPL